MSKLAEFHKLMAASGYSFQIGYMSMKEPTDEEIFYSIRKAVLEVEPCKCSQESGWDNYSDKDLGGYYGGKDE
jgi:hypothetical protein